MEKGKWVAIISGLILLIFYPFYFLYFIDYEVAGAINNDKLITFLLFIPFIIDAAILLTSRGRDQRWPLTYRILYYLNLIVFTTLLVLYLLIIFSSGGLNTKNFT